MFITLVVVAGVLCVQFIGNVKAVNSDLQGELNGDLEINYIDVNKLQLHLIHLQTLPVEKLKNVDMNYDGNITITDLTLLIQKIEKRLKPKEEISPIDYTETLENIENPEIGFYEPVSIKMKLAGNEVKNLQYNLVHLRVGIGEFSWKVN